MRAIHIVAGGLALSLLSGCSLLPSFGGDGVAATALPYRTSLSRGEDPRNVAISVRAGGASVSDVRESVRFEATRYCIANYGGSAADWTLDPATGDWAFVRDGDAMIFTARCTTR